MQTIVQKIQLACRACGHGLSIHALTAETGAKESDVRNTLTAMWRAGQASADRFTQRWTVIGGEIKS